MGVEGVKKSRGGYDYISASHWGGSGGLTLRPGIGRNPFTGKGLDVSPKYHGETAYFYTGFRNTLVAVGIESMHRLSRPLFPEFQFMNSMSYVGAKKASPESIPGEASH